MTNPKYPINAKVLWRFPMANGEKIPGVDHEVISEGVITQCYSKMSGAFGGNPEEDLYKVAVLGAPRRVNFDMLNALEENADYSDYPTMYLSESDILALVPAE